MVKEVKDGAIVASVEPPKVQVTEEVEEEVMVVSSKKKKTEAVRSAPPKKAVEKPAEVKIDVKQETIVDDWEDDWDKPSDRKTDKQQLASSKKSDDYDNWDMSDHDLQDNIEQSKKQPPKEVSPEKKPEPIKVQTIQPVQFDEIPTLKDTSPPKEEDNRAEIDFFGVDEMKGGDSDREDNVDGNPFGQSITKELL